VQKNQSTWAIYRVICSEILAMLPIYHAVGWMALIGTFLLVTIGNNLGL
jgi:hypothetical protein